MAGTTTRAALRWKGLADVANANLLSQNSMDDVDALLLMWLQGTTAARPAAAVPGRTYYETNGDRFSLDVGASWRKFLVQIASGDYKADAPVDATAYKVAGTALASTHLSDSAAVARLASPTFTGTPAAPTPAPGDNTTKVATSAFVTAAVASHTGQPTAAHAGSAVSYAGGTGMSATTMEDAIDELATEKADEANYVALRSAWATASPSLLGSGGAPNLGTGGTANMKFLKIGRTVIAQIQFLWGSPLNTFGSGEITIQIPHTMVLSTSAAPLVLGNGMLVFASTGVAWPITAVQKDGDEIRLKYKDAGSLEQNISSGLGTPTPGTYLSVNVAYETTS